MNILKLYTTIFLILLLPSLAIAADTETQKEAAKFNDQGIKAMQTSEYQQAVDDFEQAHAIMPENEIIKKNLAMAYNNYAIALNEKHKVEDAKDFLYRAIDLEKDNKHYKENLANIISSLAAGIYKNGNYDLAMFQLKESLSIIPTHVPSLILLGQIYYQTQELAKAQNVWEKAYNYDPHNKELRQMLDRLKKETKVETKLKKLDAYYFDIRFDKEAMDSEIYDFKSYLQEAYRDVGRDFNYYPQHKMPVILYTQEDFHKLRQTPEWVAGIYDGKIRLPVKKNSLSESEFRRLIWHEYTHAVVFDLSDGKCPIWFNEGLAKYEESKNEKPNLSPISKSIKDNSFIPINQLDSSFNMQSTPEKLNLAYLEAYSFIDFMMDRWNFYIIRGILQNLKHNKSLDQSLYEEVNRHMKKLQDEWMEYLKREL